MTKERMRPARLNLEVGSKGWKFKIIGIPGLRNIDTGEEVIIGKSGLQLLNVLKKFSTQMAQVKDLPKAEVEIKFSKVA